MSDIESHGQDAYVGFWARLLASIVDSILSLLIIVPVLLAVYGKEYLAVYDGVFRGPIDFLMNIVFPAAAIILFWIARSATPGKMLIRARIVDARTGGKPSTGQMIGRYLGYYVSMLPLFLGFIWIAFDKRKQGWHDKLARTVVVYTPKKDSP
ncbi:MAG: RDD family protein [Syntrophaceae bacterium]